MDSRTVQHKCPYCGKEYEIEVYDSIHAQEEPDLKERCESGDIFRVSCPHCKKDYMIQYPLIYLDSYHKFVLWVTPTKQMVQPSESTQALVKDGYRLRRCDTIQSFVEKIQIFEDGLDDVMVELAKYDCFIEFIDNKKGEAEDISSIEYQRVDNGVIKINVRTGEDGDQGMSFLIPISMLEEEMDQDKDRYEVDDREIPLINGTWITSLFVESAGKA